MDSNSGVAVGWFRPSTGGVAGFNVLGTDDEANAVTTGADGGLIVVGRAGNGAGIDALITRHVGIPIADFATDWITPGVGGFGACLETASNGATGVWNIAGNNACLTATAAAWRAIPPTSVPAAAEVAETAAPGDAANVTLRFAVRTLLAQPPGTYVAPVVFTVIAPNV